MSGMSKERRGSAKAEGQRRKVSTAFYNWRLIRYAPRPLLLLVAGDLLFLALRVVPGLIEKAAFDRLTGDAPVQFDIPALIILYVSVELGRAAAHLGDAWGGWTFRGIVGTLLQRNLFDAALRRPGPLTPPVSSGEAINRYRDDVGETGDFPTWLGGIFGEFATFFLAVGIMASINLTIT